MTSQPNCSLRTAEPAWEGVSDSRESDRHLSESLPWGEDGTEGRCNGAARGRYNCSLSSLSIHRGQPCVCRVKGYHPHFSRKIQRWEGLVHELWSIASLGFVIDAVTDLSCSIQMCSQRSEEYEVNERRINCQAINQEDFSLLKAEVI